MQNNKMKLGYQFLMFFFCCITIVSCDKKEKKLLKEYYQSGKLKKSGWYIKSQILVDTTFYYFENGNFERIEVRNDSGQLNGITKLYHDNGLVSQEISYLNNFVRGFTNSYDENGKLTSKLFYLNTRQIGDGYWYAHNGKINQYGFNGFGKEYRNFIKYDEYGKILEKIAPLIFMDSLSTYLTSDEKVYDVSLLLSNPPNCRTSVLINYISKDSIIKRQDSVISQPYYFKKEKFSSDIDRVMFYGKQYDSLTGKTLSQNMTHSMRN